METRQVRAAVAVARCGSFVRAARELHVAPSTLSRQVAALERDVGFVLFLRRAAAVELTRPGRIFLAEADALLAELSRAARDARAASEREPRDAI